MWRRPSSSTLHSRQPRESGRVTGLVEPRPNFNDPFLTKSYPCWRRELNPLAPAAGPFLVSGMSGVFSPASAIATSLSTRSADLLMYAGLGCRNWRLESRQTGFDILKLINAPFSLPARSVLEACVCWAPHKAYYSRDYIAQICAFPSCLPYFFVFSPFAA